MTRAPVVVGKNTSIAASADEDQRYRGRFVLASCARIEMGIGLAGRTFACKRMPLRATNSTQVLFVLRPPPRVLQGRIRA